ncbi:MAG TPA: hypothetical protein VFF68_06520 [Anaerolineaceae bacterium]|nr:hypothetical protein [Anaerolineaceae bacterium]
MRKVALFLTTLVFFGCLAIGIYLSNQSSLASAFQTTPATEVPAPTELTHQTNLIFVHVDDLKAPRPALRSLWGFFISLQDPAGVMVTPLLPFASEATQQKLLSSFRLNENGSLDSRFTETVRKSLELTFAEYILIDDTGMSLTAQWLSERGGVPLDVSIAPAETLPEAEQAFFTAACSAVTTLPPGGPVFIWDEILPDHGYTNLPFQNAIRMWMTLADPEKPARCEVFYPNRTQDFPE